MSIISILSPNRKQLIASKPLLNILHQIKSGLYSEEIGKLRQAFESNVESPEAIQNDIIPWFSISGHFKQRQKSLELVSYSSYMIFEIIYLNETDQAGFKEALIESPSGNGLKIIVETDANVESHVLVFQTLVQYYELKLGIPIDKSGKDITRLCFFSHDPQIYYNPTSEIFSIVIGHRGENEIVPAFEECVAFTKQKSTYVNGNRNNFLYPLASNCNRAGLEQSEALTQILGRYDLSPDEIRQSVASAHKHRNYEFKNLEIDPPVKSSTPYMPNRIFQRLPALLSWMV